MSIRRNPVSSTNVRSIGYDERSQTLEVEFQSGSVYRYFNVPKTIVDAFLAAPSKGQFLSSQIRNRFPYARVG